MPTYLKMILIGVFGYSWVILWIWYCIDKVRKKQKQEEEIRFYKKLSKRRRFFY